MKRLLKFSLPFYFILLNFNFSFSQKVKIVGPTGTAIWKELDVQEITPCIVNGVTINASGTYQSIPYVPPVTVNSCVATPYTSYSVWTTSDSTGFIRYTFSQPVISATIGYRAVNAYDIGRITINGTSAAQLSNPCGVTFDSNNYVYGDFTGGTNPSGDVRFTVSSSTPFTTITLTNVGGQNGWISSNLCDFTFMLPPAVIVADPKISYGQCLSSFGSVIPSVFTSSTGGAASWRPITIDGVQANASNVTITSVLPTPPYTGNVNVIPPQPMPNWLTFNADGTITVSPFAPTNIEAEFYFIVCSLGGGTCTVPIRYNVKRYVTCKTINTELFVTVFPNPSKDTFVLNFDKIKDTVQIEVYDFYGKVYLKTQETNLNSYTINAQDYPKGTYILKIIDNETVVTKQLIKE